jgi:ribonuclease P protein component
VLSPAHRLTSPKDFSHAVRKGSRSGSPLLVVHQSSATSTAVEPSGSPRVGFVVSRAVGNAVVRNRVKRRLRHLCRERIGTLQSGTLTVVRATPQAAEATYGELEAALNRCLARVRQHAGSNS